MGWFSVVGASFRAAWAAWDAQKVHPMKILCWLGFHRWVEMNGLVSYKGFVNPIKYERCSRCYKRKSAP